MKTFGFALVLLLIGCAPSTSALVNAAQVSGDWSRVDERYDAIDRRGEKLGRRCTKGSTALCVKRLGDEDCRCIPDPVFRERLERTVKGPRGRRALP